MKSTSITLVACIASASAFAPSSVNNIALHSTELNARPKLAKKSTAGAEKSQPAVSFQKPSFQLPWDKPEPVTATKGKPVKKGRGKLADKGGNTRLAQRVFDMDLYAPVADQNDYGARRKKDLKTGSLSKNSYVPAGLTKAQYEKIRNKDTKKKSDNYERNVAKAGKFSDFYAFYKNRGTDLKDTWRDVTNSHTMAKTKYDWQGDDDKAGGGIGR